MHVLNDVEIDLETLPSRVVPERGAGVGWAAHWLAIEGVQPAIPQNPVRPSAGMRPGAFAAPAPAQSAGAEQGSATGKSASVKPLIKHVLSRELQLYFERIVSSLLAAPLPPAPDTAAASTSADAQSAPTNSAREAALAALRGDAGLAQLLPYLVQWVGEQTTAHLSDAQALSVVLRAAEALLHNSTLVIEPYVSTPTVGLRQHRDAH
jgi:transcription initiation factor TFIID subunit 6